MLNLKLFQRKLFKNSFNRYSSAVKYFRVFFYEFKITVVWKFEVRTNIKYNSFRLKKKVLLKMLQMFMKTMYQRQLMIWIYLDISKNKIVV